MNAYMGFLTAVVATLGAIILFLVGILVAALLVFEVKGEWKSFRKGK